MMMANEQNEMTDQLAGWDALPSDILTKIKAIKEDKTLSSQAKCEQMNALITGLPDEIVDKIPDPPMFERIPEELKQRFKQIFRQKGKLFTEKCEEADKLIGTMPLDQRPAFVAFKESIILFLAYT